MKQARYKEPLPLAVIEAARAGDAGAVEQVLQYYNGYISKAAFSCFACAGKRCATVSRKSRER